MSDKIWLDKVVLAAQVYNDSRLHTDFQEDEVLKFLEYLHSVYGVEYHKPKPQHKNTPK